MRPALLAVAFAALVSAQNRPATTNAATTSTSAPSANPSANSPGIDKKAIEEYVRYLFIWGPPIQVAVSDPKPSEVPGFSEITVTGSLNGESQSEIFLIGADGRKIIRGTVYDLKRSPFSDDLAKIRTDTAPSTGPSMAPVQIVIFNDLQCSFCRGEAQVLRKQLQPAFPKEVRLIFKDFPLESIHPWARKAALAGRCIAAQNNDAFWQYHDWIFDHQSEVNAGNADEKLTAWVAAANLSPDKYKSCLVDPKTTEAVNRSIAEAERLGVNSTPTLFINGRRQVGAIEYDRLKSIVALELAHMGMVDLVPKKAAPGQ